MQSLINLTYRGVSYQPVAISVQTVSQQQARYRGATYPIQKAVNVSKSNSDQVLIYRGICYPSY